MKQLQHPMITYIEMTGGPTQEYYCDKCISEIASFENVFLDPFGHSFGCDNCIEEIEADGTEYCEECGTYITEGTMILVDKEEYVLNKKKELVACENCGYHKREAGDYFGV